MMEIFTIVICFIKKYIIGWANRRNLAKLQPIPDQPYVPPVNPEIEALKSRKAEIESTIQQFNNPSTFVKYSKMQRELTKIEGKIEELTVKVGQQNNTSRAKWEQQMELKKKIREQQRSTYNKRSWIIRILVNFALIRVVHNYYSFPIPFAHQWPLSMFTNEQGQIKCSVLMAMGNMLFQF